MDDQVSIAEAAQEAGVPLCEFISWMHRAGELLLIPGTDDPRCHVWMPGFESHAPECFCQFVVAHPDVVEMEEGA